MSKVWSKSSLLASGPESNRPSALPSEPEVTVWLPALTSQRTRVPLVTVSDPLPKEKLPTSTDTVASAEVVEVAWVEVVAWLVEVAWLVVAAWLVLVAWLVEVLWLVEVEDSPAADDVSVTVVD